MGQVEEWLQQCRHEFGEAPRQFSWIDRMTYLSSNRPSWCKRTDKLTLYFDNQKQLLEQGDVVWGCVVQANQLLFSPGTMSCPGDVVYCLERDRPDVLETLRQVARELYQLKGEPQDRAELNEISQYLANERIRVFGLPVPETISPTMPCAISSVYFDRRHLPDRVLRQSFFPIVLSRTTPHIATILPGRYWSQSLLNVWRSRR